MRDLIDVFTDERLLVQDRQEDNDGDIQVRVAHDALLNHWKRAKEIIDGFLADKQLYERLKGQMMEWKTCQPDEADCYLLKAGPALTKAEDLRTRLNKLLDDEVIEWIDASTQADRKHRETEIARIEAEQEKELQNQKRSVRRARRLAAIMTILFGFALGAGFIAWQAKQEAELNFDESRKTVDSFVYEISRDELADIPGLQVLREKFARKAIKQYAAFIERNPHNNDVRIGYAKAKGTLGTILSAVGSIDEAVKEIQEAIQLLEVDVKTQSKEWVYQLELANRYMELSHLYWSIEKHQEGVPYIELAIQTLQSISTNYQQDSEVIYSLAKAYNRRGSLNRRMNFEDRGIKDYEHSIELVSQIIDTYKDKTDATLIVSSSIHNLSLAYRFKKNYKKSLELLDESDEYDSEYRKLTPHSPTLMSNQSIFLRNRASLLELMNQPEEARTYYEKAKKINRELVKNNPKVTRFNWLLAILLKKYAAFLSSVGEYKNSQKTYEEAASILEDITQRKNDRAYYGVALVEVLYSLTEFHRGDKGSIPKDEKAWKNTIDKMLETATRMVNAHPSDTKVNFELSKALNARGLFEAENKNKNDQASLDYYMQALHVYSEKSYREREPSNSYYVAEFLGFTESAIYTARRLNRIDDAKTINELAYQIGKTHTTMAGIQSLGKTFGVYSRMLQKAELYPQAIDTRLKQLEITEPIWKKAEWNWWLRSQVGAAYFNLKKLYQKTNNQLEEIRTSISWLQTWGTPMHGIDAKEYLKIDPLQANADELQKLREVTNKKYSMKKFTIPAEFGGIKYPFHVYITNVPWPKDPLEDQARWLEEERGGKISEDVWESFRKLHKIAHENNVSFTELAVYALENASKNKSKKIDKNSE